MGCAAIESVRQRLVDVPISLRRAAASVVPTPGIEGWRNVACAKHMGLEVIHKSQQCAMLNNGCAAAKLMKIR